MGVIGTETHECSSREIPESHWDPNGSCEEAGVGLLLAGRSAENNCCRGKVEGRVASALRAIGYLPVFHMLAQ